MPSIRTIFSAIFLFIALTPFTAGSSPEQNHEDERDIETFQKLLSEVDPPSLHEALHSISPKKYKHGAFPEDRTAVEVIHKEEPSVATSIVNLARRQVIEVVDLSKRQAAGDISNGTTTTNALPLPKEQTSTRVTPVPQESSTPTPGSTTEPSTNVPVTNTPSSTPTVAATTSAVPSPSTTLATSAQASTSSAPSIIPSTTANSISLTAGEVITTTNAVGLTIISTVGGGASTISRTQKVTTTTNTHNAGPATSVAVQTTTLPNGSQSVVTAVTVVGAGNSGAGDTPTGTAGVGPTSASSSPGLQTGEAVMSRSWGKEMVLVVGGAVAFAGMM